MSEISDREDESCANWDISQEQYAPIENVAQATEEEKGRASFIFEYLNNKQQLELKDKFKFI